MAATSGNCQKCGTWRRSLHKDHIVSRLIGGADEPSNWQRLCANCHEEKTYFERQVPEWKTAASKRQSGRGVRSQAYRQKMSAALKGRKRGPMAADIRAKISASKLGKSTLTRDQIDRTNQKLRDRWLGLTTEQRLKQTTGFSRGNSPEARAKKSRSLMGRSREWLLGCTRSAETRAKISATLTGRKRNEQKACY